MGEERSERLCVLDVRVRETEQRQSKQAPVTLGVHANFGDCSTASQRLAAWVATHNEAPLFSPPQPPTSLTHQRGEQPNPTHIPNTQASKPHHV